MKRALIPDVVFWLGALLLSGGAAMIYIPAGMIVAGIVLIVWSVLTAVVHAREAE